MAKKPPIPPVDLCQAGVGTGKSFTVRQHIPEMLKGRGEKESICIFVPTHKLGDEHADEIRELVGDNIKVMQYRGRDADDPANQGKKMCWLSEEAKELSIAGGDPANLCSKGRGEDRVFCEHFQKCGYIRQRAQRADVWVLAHNNLGMAKPNCIEGVRSVIVDENPINALLNGFDGNKQVSLDELRLDRPVPEKPDSKIIDGAGSADLNALCSGILKSIDGVEGVIRTEKLFENSVNPELLADGVKLIMRCKKTPKIVPNMKPSVRNDITKEAQIQNAPLLRLRRLFLCIRAAFDNNYYIVPGCRVERALKGPEGVQYDAISYHWKAEVHSDWHYPTLILDATANKRLLTAFWPQLGDVGEFYPDAPHMSVRQVLWSASASKLAMKEGAKDFDTRERNTQKIWRYVCARAFEYRGQAKQGPDVLLIAQERIKSQIMELGLPDNVETAHFNAVAGIDKWKHVRCIVVIGRTLPSPDSVEMIAEVLSGEEIQRGDEWDSSWYPSRLIEPLHREGTKPILPINANYHPNELAEDVRWMTCDAEIEQAIGRGRGVNRTASNPLQVDVINTVPLRVPVDKVLTWKQAQPSLFDVMASRGVVLDCDMSAKGSMGIISKCLPEMFEKPEAVKQWKKRNGSLTVSNANKDYYLANDTVRGFKPAKVRLEGTRYNVRVKINTSLGEPKQVAENILGPLSKFELLPHLEYVRHDVAGYPDRNQTTIKAQKYVFPNSLFELPADGPTLKKVDIGLPMEGVDERFVHPDQAAEINHENVTSICSDSHHKTEADTFPHTGECKSFHEICEELDDGLFLGPEGFDEATERWLAQHQKPTMKETAIGL